MKLNKKVRQAVLERDNGRCQRCGNIAVDEHHILYKSLGGDEKEENLICLCRSCHDQAHANGKEMFIELLELQRRRYPGLTRKDLKK